MWETIGLSISPPIARGPPIPAAGARPARAPEAAPKRRGFDSSLPQPDFFCFCFCFCFCFMVGGGLGGLGGAEAPGHPPSPAAPAASPRLRVAPAGPPSPAAPRFPWRPHDLPRMPGRVALPSRPALRASARPRVARRRPREWLLPRPAPALLPAPCSERTRVPARHASCVMPQPPSSPVSSFLLLSVR